jgi:hypothetical protein
MDVFAHIRESEEALRQATSHVAKYTDVDDGIFENVLYLANYTNFVTCTKNTGIRNSTRYLFLINNSATVL